MFNRIIGPSGGRRRRRFLLAAPFAAIGVLLSAMIALAGPVGNLAGFEDDDGNLAPEGTIQFDWNSFAPATWSPHPATTPTRQTDDKTVNGFQFKGVEDYPNPGAASGTTADTSFNGGVKQDHNCAGVGTGKPPNKDDVTRVYLASKVVSGQTFLELAWARIPQNSTSASAHVGFEFNQGETLCPAGSDGLVQRTAGDMLIVYDFEGGSAPPILTLRRWTTDPAAACEVGSNSPPCWGTAQDLTAGGFAEGKVNTTTAADLLSPPALNSATGTSESRNLATQEFGEAGINLTAAGVIPTDSCVSFGKAYAVSRSSGNSANAQMKDLVGPVNFNLNNCGQIIIKKHSNPRGVDQDFGFTSNITGAQLTCTPDTTPATFTLNDHAGNDNPAAGGNIEDCDKVPAGTYTVTEGADPNGFAFNNFSCTSSGAGTSTTPISSTTQKNVSITVAGGGVVTCTYTNDQQLGAIEVTKTRKFAGDGPGDHPHPGVTFTVSQGGSEIASEETGSDGKVCFDGLPFGDYTVSESVPAGYSLDAPGNDRLVTVDNNAKCSDNPVGGEPVTFRNTPLTDIDVDATAQDPGATKSDITCVDESDADIGNSGGFNDPAHADADDLPPGTYTCTVVVDP